MSGVPRRAPRGWRNVNRTEAEPQMWRRRHESHGPLGAGHAAAGPAGPPGGAAVNRAASLGDVSGGVSHARSECRAPRFAHPRKRHPPSPGQKPASRALGRGPPEAATTTAARVTSFWAKAAGRLSDRQPTCHRSSEGDHQGHVTLITGQHPCDGRSHCTL